MRIIEDVIESMIVMGDKYGPSLGELRLWAEQERDNRKEIRSLTAEIERLKRLCSRAADWIEEELTSVDHPDVVEGYAEDRDLLAELRAEGKGK